MFCCFPICLRNVLIVSPQHELLANYLPPDSYQGSKLPCSYVSMQTSSCKRMHILFVCVCCAPEPVWFTWGARFSILFCKFACYLPFRTRMNERRPPYFSTSNFEHYPCDLTFNFLSYNVCHIITYLKSTLKRHCANYIYCCFVLIWYGIRSTDYDLFTIAQDWAGKTHVLLALEIQNLICSDIHSSKKNKGSGEYYMLIIYW